MYMYVKSCHSKLILLYHINDSFVIYMYIQLYCHYVYIYSVMYTITCTVLVVGACITKDVA